MRGGGGGGGGVGVCGVLPHSKVNIMNAFLEIKVYSCSLPPEVRGL